MILVLSISIPLGIFSALRPRSLLDRAAMVYVLIGISLPSFWIGLVLSYVVGFKLGMDAARRLLRGRHRARGGRAAAGSFDWAYHMVLPCMTLAIVVAGTYVRFVRAEVMETMQPGLRANRTRQGRARAHRDSLARAAERDAAGRHDGRHGHRPAARRRDLHRGRLRPPRARRHCAYGRSARFDLPTLQGVVIFGAVAIIIFSLVVDILYAWIDPRIRLT